MSYYLGYLLFHVVHELPLWDVTLIVHDAGAFHQATPEPQKGRSAFKSTPHIRYLDFRWEWYWFKEVTEFQVTAVEILCMDVAIPAALDRI